MIEFQLENGADAEHRLEVLAPNGSELGEGEFVVELGNRGTYQVKVIADGHEDRATTLQLSVGE